jgi:hypothetical protein
MPSWLFALCNLLGSHSLNRSVRLVPNIYNCSFPGIFLVTKGVTQWIFNPNSRKSDCLTFTGIYFHVISYRTFSQGVQILLKFPRVYIFWNFLNFSLHQAIPAFEVRIKIWDWKCVSCFFCSQVKSSQCWNWNLTYHKFWEVSRSLKVTPKKAFALVMILFWKVPVAWKWSCNCGNQWKFHPKDWYNFNNIHTMWNVSVCVSRIAVKWQIEVRERLLSFGAEYFVLQFTFQKINIKVNRTVIFIVALYMSKICL